MNKPKIALTIAGTDPTGGAGVMADLKSFHACGVYGMATITSIVAQNTKGVQAVHEVPTDFVIKQVSSALISSLISHHFPSRSRYLRWFVACLC